MAIPTELGPDGGEGCLTQLVLLTFHAPKHVSVRRGAPRDY